MVGAAPRAPTTTKGNSLASRSPTTINSRIHRRMVATTVLSKAVLKEAIKAKILSSHTHNTTRVNNSPTTNSSNKGASKRVVQEEGMTLHPRRDLTPDLRPQPQVRLRLQVVK